MAESSWPETGRLKRSNTLIKINEFMEDRMLEQDDELDLITFIMLAQSLKPGAEQEELEEIFTAAEGETENNMSDKVQAMLSRVSGVNKANTDAATPDPSGDVEEESSDESEELPVIHGTGRRQSVVDGAELDAAANYAKTEQKMDIAQEMLRQGMSLDVVASVTGLSGDTLDCLATDSEVMSPRSPDVMDSSQISEVIRLCNAGPDQIKQEAELAHTLMVSLKDHVLSMSAAVKPKAVPKASKAGCLSPRVRMTSQEALAKYEVVFEKKPLGMSWNQTSDGKNLYVQDVLSGGLGESLGVKVGSVIDSFNGQAVFDQGPDKIYLAFKACSLPITIGFRNPVASGSEDPKVIMLKEVTGLETETVVKLLHKFNGNVQAANEAFFIAKARTREFIAKKQQSTAEGKGRQDGEAQDAGAPKRKKSKKKKSSKWWKSWAQTASRPD